MSTLSSASTIDEIKAAYADNASYEEDGSASKARAFVTACRLLLLKLPKMATTEGGRQQLMLAPELIQQEMHRASSWLATSGATGGSGGGVRHVDLQGFRD